MKATANVKIAAQYSENFGGDKCPTPGFAPDREHRRSQQARNQGPHGGKSSLENLFALPGKMYWT